MPNDDTVRAIIPMLVCHDAGAEVEFCKTVFDAEELARRSADNGDVVHATLRIGNEMLMVHNVSEVLESRPPSLDGSSPVVIYIYLEDVDAVMGMASNAGARVLLPAADQYWGDRVGRIMDPAGHVWNVAARIKGQPEPR